MAAKNSPTPQTPLASQSMKTSRCSTQKKSLGLQSSPNATTDPTFKGAEVAAAPATAVVATQPDDKGKDVDAPKIDLDNLDQSISNRKGLRQLMHENILQDVSGSENKVQKEMFRTLQEINLSDFLTKRPAYRDLIYKNLVQDTMTWRRITFDPPFDYSEPRNLHTATVIGRKLYIIGGFALPHLTRPFLYLDFDTMRWHQPQFALGQLHRFMHSTVASQSTLLMFGGCDMAGVYFNDLLCCTTVEESNAYAGPQWYHLNMFVGTPPSPRGNHAATMVGTKMYIFGGRDQTKVFNDLHLFDMEAMSWTNLATHDLPPPRAGHSMCLLGNKLVVFGGFGADHRPRDDLFILDLDTLLWTKPQTNGTPPVARTGHVAHRIQDNVMLIFGGGYWDKVYNDLHTFDMSSLTWSRPSDSGTLPSPRAGCSACMVDTQLCILGGGDVSTVYSDMYVLDTSFLRISNAATLDTPRAKSSPVVFEWGNNGSSASIKDSTELSEEVGVKQVAEDMSEFVHSVTSMQGTISIQLQRVKANARLRQQHFLSLVSDLGTHHETELNKLSQKVEMFQQSVVHQMGKMTEKLDALLKQQSVRTSPVATPPVVNPTPSVGLPTMTPTIPPVNIGFMNQNNKDKVPGTGFYNPPSVGTAAPYPTAGPVVMMNCPQGASLPGPSGQNPSAPNYKASPYCPPHPHLQPETNQSNFGSRLAGTHPAPMWNKKGTVINSVPPQRCVPPSVSQIPTMGARNSWTYPSTDANKQLHGQNESGVAEAIKNRSNLLTDQAQMQTTNVDISIAAGTANVDISIGSGGEAKLNPKRLLTYPYGQNGAKPTIKYLPTSKIPKTSKIVIEEENWNSEDVAWGDLPVVSIEKFNASS